MTFAVCLSNSPLANAQCLRYSVDVIRPPPCALLYPQATVHSLNESGHLAGGWGSCGSQVRFLGTGGPSVIPINVPGFPFGVNSSHQIVGTFDNATGHFGYFWQNGALVNVGLSNNTFSECLAINESGQACGYAHIPRGQGVVQRSYIWQNGNGTDLNIPGNVSEANAINNLAQVTGWMGVGDVPPFYGEAFIWQQGMTTPL